MNALSLPKKWAQDLGSLPGDAALAWRLGGAGAVWAEVAERTAYRVFRTGRFVVMAQDLARVQRVSVPEGVVIRPFGGADWSPLTCIAGERRVAQFRERMARGCSCLVAWRGERAIGYTWLWTWHTPPGAERMSLPLPLPLPRDAAYLWDLYVVPAERNSGVGSALVTARLDEAARCGFREGWRMVAPSNRPSLRTAAKTAGTGMRLIGEIRYVKLLAHTRARFEPYQSPPPVQ